MAPNCFVRFVYAFRYTILYEVEAVHLYVDWLQPVVGGAFLICH